MENFLVGNVEFDSSTDDKYLAIAESGVKPFNIPSNMNRCSFIQVDNDIVEYICQDNVEELENYEYTKEQINNKIELLKSEVSKHISDVISTSNNDVSYKSDSLNDDKLIIRPASR